MLPLIFLVEFEVRAKLMAEFNCRYRVTVRFVNGSIRLVHFTSIIDLEEPPDSSTNYNRYLRKEMEPTSALG